MMYRSKGGANQPWRGRGRVKSEAQAKYPEMSVRKAIKVAKASTVALGNEKQNKTAITLSA